MWSLDPNVYALRGLLKLKGGAVSLTITWEIPLQNCASNTAAGPDYGDHLMSVEYRIVGSLYTIYA